MTHALLRCWIILLGIVGCGVGCARTPNGAWQASLPWTRQLPQGPNPWQSPADYYGQRDPYGVARDPIDRRIHQASPLCLNVQSFRLARIRMV